MVEYITEDGSPHVISTGSTIPNAARSAFVELITRHNLEDIIIHGVTDLGVNPDGPPSHIIQIKYTDKSRHGSTEAEPQPITLRADSTPLSADGNPITAENSKTSQWKVSIVDIFRND